MRFLKLIFIFLIMMIGAAFAVMNADTVKLNYYFGVQELPLSVILVGAIGVGALLGVLATLVGSLKLKRENMTLKHKAKVARQEVNNLRSIPIKDS
ncbi:LapA family protein [Sedimenticola selenatireducens]|uniref:LapA family protein n=1 Tax=Sedimenticola selenatireducens TaxID=191960 RepID=A0A558DS13_9GAMM|nr:LapA family protein [Sedimenticola selenatireducens]TVO75920.1 LapA family protein [Sedimenticola selenatireducens]TVT63779.1 MAG: LapA family protein [Sedimenticola selenatireducens]